MQTQIIETATGKYQLPLLSGDIIIQAIKNNKVFDANVVDVAREYIRPGTAVLDVGANFGQMSILFSKMVGENGLVYSFEAEEFVYSLLTKNIELNNIKNIKPIFGAVYNTIDEVKYYPIPDFKQFATYGSYGIKPLATEGRTVKTLTIDSLEIKMPISFMKVDIQGSDLFALKGAKETILNNKMPIVFEFEPIFQNEFKTSLNDYMEFINSINYEVKKMISDHDYLILPKQC